MQMVVGVFGGKMAVIFRFSGVGPNARILGCFGQPTYCLRTVKTVRVDGWTKNCPCELFAKYCLNWMAWIVWKMIC